MSSLAYNQVYHVQSNRQRARMVPRVVTCHRYTLLALAAPPTEREGTARPALSHAARGICGLSGESAWLTHFFPLREGEQFIDGLDDDRRIDVVGATKNGLLDVALAPAQRIVLESVVVQAPSPGTEALP